MDLEGVESLARKSHAGQKDKLDRDYFDHHLTPVVGKLSGQGMHAVMAGWLHDILEDTPVTSADLVEAGVPAEVVCAVESVTKREGER